MIEYASRFDVEEAIERTLADTGMTHIELVAYLNVFLREHQLESQVPPCDAEILRDTLLAQLQRDKPSQVLH